MAKKSRGREGTLYGNDKVQVSAYVTASQRERLRREAARQGVSTSGLLSQYIVENLKGKK